MTPRPTIPNHIRNDIRQMADRIFKSAEPGEVFPYITEVLFWLATDGGDDE